MSKHPSERLTPSAPRVPSSPVKPREVGAPLTFHHTNGWTLSVNHNIGPGYSVIAYPTVDGGFTTEAMDHCFKFETGRGGDCREAWCASLSGLVVLATEVMNARPPKESK